MSYCVCVLQVKRRIWRLYLSVHLCTVSLHGGEMPTMVMTTNIPTHPPSRTGTTPAFKQVTNRNTCLMLVSQGNPFDIYGKDGGWHLWAKMSYLIWQSFWNCIKSSDTLMMSKRMSELFIIFRVGDDFFHFVTIPL